MRPVYSPPGPSNSQATSWPSRASFAHFDFFSAFCSSHKCPPLSVNERSPECPRCSVHDFMFFSSGNQFTHPSLPKVFLYPGGIFGLHSRSLKLQLGQGMPAPPQWQASPRSLAPPQGLSSWSSHTQRSSPQTLQAMLVLFSRVGIPMGGVSVPRNTEAEACKFRSGRR